MTPSRRATMLGAMFTLTAVIGGAGVAVAQAPGLPLAPHRAAYELSLLSVRGKNVAAASGRIGLEFTGSSCEGYATNFRLATRIMDGEGQSRLSDTRTTSFESGDGRSLRFRSESRVNDRVTQRTDGTAERAADGGLSIDLREPKPNKVDADAAAIFPNDHTLRLLAAARAGQRIVEVKVYDGSDGGEKIYDTTAIIGAEIPASGRPVEEASEKAGLKDMRRWPVAISYFEQGQGERTPVYVLSFDMFENGVAGALKLDFGEFSLKGEMTRLEMLKAPDCKN